MLQLVIRAIRGVRPRAEGPRVAKAAPWNAFSQRRMGSSPFGYINEPAREFAVSSVELKLVSRHPFEKLMQADLLFRSYPSPDRVDFGEHPDGSDGCRARHFDVANSLDDAFESGANVLLTLREKLKGPGVPINGCPICEPVFCRDRDRTCPCDEILFNLKPFRMETDGAGASMTPEADGFLFSQSLHLPSRMTANHLAIGDQLFAF